MPNPNTRYRLIPSILFFYLLPILCLSAYSLSLSSEERSWSLFALGLIISFCGSTLLYLLLVRWESSLTPHQEPVAAAKIPPPPIPEPTIIVKEPDPKEQERLIEEAVTMWQQKNNELSHELTERQTELLQMRKDYENVQHQLQSIKHEYATFQDGVLIQLDQKDQQISQHLQTLLEHRTLIEKHQQHISLLETKEKDLSYEIKTLLHLATLDSIPTESPKPVKYDTQEFFSDADDDYYVREEAKNPYRVSSSSSVKPIDNAESASTQLKHCLDIATKMSGANYLLGSGSRLQNFSMDNSALDLRRLCDALNSENRSLVLLYSQKEGKMLFVNDLAKNSLGWNPEKFSESFPEMIAAGTDAWRQGLSQLALQNQVTFPLSLRSKGGQDISYQCCLGLVPAGAFRHHVIGILYESTKQTI